MESEPTASEACAGECVATEVRGSQQGEPGVEATVHGHDGPVRGR